MHVTPLLIVAVVSIFYSAALVLKLVKPNRLFGWHLPTGREDDEELWYRLNRFFGTHFLVSNLVVVAFILFNYYTGSMSLEQGSTATIIAWILFAVGFIGSTARTFALQKEAIAEGKPDDADNE